MNPDTDYPADEQQVLLDVQTPAGNGTGPTQTMPPDPTGAKRRGWSQQQIVQLVQAHAQGKLQDFGTLHAIGPEDVRAKLMALGIIPKPRAAQTAVVNDLDKRAIDDFLGKMRLIHTGTGQHAGDTTRAVASLRYLIRQATELKKSLGASPE